MKPELISYMMDSFLEDFRYEPVSVIEEAIKDLASGKKKIYGKVTPNDIRELILEKTELEAIKREKKHEAQKNENHINRGKATSLRDYIKGAKRK